MNEEFRIICDGGSLRIYKGDYGFNFEEIVDLLNEQQATIDSLQKNKAQLKERLREQGMRLDKLLGNCKELRKELGDYYG